MKSILSTPFKIALAVVFFFSSKCFAYDFEVDGLWYSLHSSGSNVTLVGTSNREGNLVIPENVTYRNRTFTVSDLKSRCFYGCNFNKVSIPSTIDCIPTSAFEDAGISDLILSEGITKIDDRAFAGCKFSSLNIPYTVEYIGVEAFMGCQNLKEVHIYEGVPNIYAGAFYNCTNIDTIVCHSDFYPPASRLSFDTENPFFSNVTYQFATLKVPANGIGKYKADKLWGKFAIIEPIEGKLTHFQELDQQWDLMGKPLYDAVRLYDEFEISRNVDKKGKPVIVMEKPMEVLDTIRFVDNVGWGDFVRKGRFLLFNFGNEYNMLRCSIKPDSIATPIDFIGINKSENGCAVWDCESETGEKVHIEFYGLTSSPISRDGSYFFKGLANKLKPTDKAMSINTIAFITFSNKETHKEYLLCLNCQNYRSINTEKLPKFKFWEWKFKVMDQQKNKLRDFKLSY